MDHNNRGRQTVNESDERTETAVSTRSLKKSISEFLKQLGQGLCGPVPYETAWVARVPQADNLELPAFPLSLQWLRDNQLKDGSWGRTQPFSPNSSTINTLAAIVSLAQWNDPKDKILIGRGIEALWDLAGHLEDDVHEPIGFELILPALQSDARKYGLGIPYEHYTIYEQKGREKLELILCEIEKNGFTEPATWWHNLEILGDNFEVNGNNNGIAFSPKMIMNGSVGVSPSATAYLLRSQRLKGIDIPEAESYLQKMYTLYKGGISQIFPIDLFELAFGVDFFLRAGFSARNPLFRDSINLLSERCASRTTVGFSSHFPISDADDSAVALYVLHQAGYKVSVEDLLKFFNGNHFLTFNFEMNFSVSTNINVLTVLKLFRGNNQIDDVIEKVTNFIEKSAFSNAHVLVDDKWHKSVFYCTSRAVFSLHGLMDSTVKNCIDFFIKSQNDDGGWGTDGFSTAEESAYVALALVYGLKNGYHNVISVGVLEAANRFLENGKKDEAEVWIGKVLYRPTLVAESAILAARYALTKALKFYNTQTLLLLENQLEFVNVTYVTDRWNYCGPLLCSSFEFDAAKYSEQVVRVEKYVVEKLIELQHIEVGESIKKFSPEMSVNTIRSELSDENLIVYSFISIIIFTYDDIFDDEYYRKKFGDNTKLIRQVLQVFLDILSGEYPNIDLISPLEFPKFTSLCRLFREVRIQIKDESNVDEFLLEMRNYFDAYIEEFEKRISGKSVSSKEYLKISRISSGLHLFSSIYYIFKNVNISSFKDNKLFKEFQYRASVATRFILDIFSFSRDEQEGNENYVLLKQSELNCSLKQALTLAIKSYNKQVMKMKCIRKMMESELNHSNDRNLFQAISFMENFVNGVIDWSSVTPRYRSKQSAELSISLSRRQRQKFHPGFLVE